MTSSSNKLEVIKMSLKNAQTWESKGDPVWTDSCLSMALMNLLSIAVEDHADAAFAVEWLRANNCHVVLRKQHENLQRLIEAIDAGHVPSSTIAGNYTHLTFAHLSWALREFLLGEDYIAVSEREDVKDASTPFWCEYARGMGALVRGEPYQIKPMKFQGQEQYWIAYLQLVEATCNRADTIEALSMIEKSFSIRNSDKRIADDNYETEGSGEHPVQWDYRRDSLLNYLGKKATDARA